MTREEIKRCIKLFLDIYYASDNHNECAENLVSEYEQQIRAEVIEKIKAKAHCEDTECWDCAFGDAEVGCLLKENK